MAISARPSIFSSIGAICCLSLGRGARGGRWLVRWRTNARRYRQEVLATADDALAADGVTVLAFNQAVIRARDVVTRHRADEVATAAGPVLTVKDAVRDYIDERERYETGRKRDARSRLSRHVLSAPLADIPLHLLTERDLTGWRAQLAAGLAWGSIRRTTNDLKAAFNRAARISRAQLPAHISVVVRNGCAVKEESSPVPREAQVPCDEEVRGVIRARARQAAARPARASRRRRRRFVRACALLRSRAQSPKVASSTSVRPTSWKARKVPSPWTRAVSSMSCTNRDRLKTSGTQWCGCVGQSFPLRISAATRRCGARKSSQRSQAVAIRESRD